MVGSVLVDSCYYITRLKRGFDPAEDFIAWADDCDFYTCGVVKIEVLRGLKLKKTYDRVGELMGCMLYVPTGNSIWERAQKLAHDLDRQGIVMQVTDLIIAACALEVGATVLTYDSDFYRVPKLRVIDSLE